MLVDNALPFSEIPLTGSLLNSCQWAVSKSPVLTPLSLYIVLDVLYALAVAEWVCLKLLNYMVVLLVGF